MKKGIIGILLSVLFACCLAGCKSYTLLEEPEEFSFSLVWDTYGVSSYDSETGTLVKTSHATNPEEYITTYLLSEEEKQTIYDMIRKMEVSSYPDHYNPNPNVYSAPSMSIVLTVHTDTIDKIISAEDIAISYDCKNKKGQKFLSTVKAIIDILTETEEWKALPDYEFYYL